MNAAARRACSARRTTTTPPQLEKADERREKPLLHQEREKASTSVVMRVICARSSPGRKSRARGVAGVQTFARGAKKKVLGRPVPSKSARRGSVIRVDLRIDEAVRASARGWARRCHGREWSAPVRRHARSQLRGLQALMQEPVVPGDDVWSEKKMVGLIAG